jgi:hypothetical protein
MKEHHIPREDETHKAERGEPCEQQTDERERAVLLMLDSVKQKLR